MKASTKRKPARSPAQSAPGKRYPFPLQGNISELHDIAIRLEEFKRDSKEYRQALTDYAAFMSRQLAPSVRKNVLVTGKSEIVKEAQRIFGDAQTAQSWLKHKRAKFDGKSPMEMMDSEAGRLAVKVLLGQIDHGIFG